MDNRQRKRKFEEKIIALLTATTLITASPDDSAQAMEEREHVLYPEAITEIYIPPEEPVLIQPEELENKKRRQELSVGKKSVLILCAALVYIVLMGILSATLVALPAIAAAAVKLVVGTILCAVLTIALLKLFNPDKTVAEILRDLRPAKAMLIFAAVLALCVIGRAALSQFKIPSAAELVIPSAAMALGLILLTNRKKS